MKIKNDQNGTLPGEVSIKRKTALSDLPTKTKLLLLLLGFVPFLLSGCKKEEGPYEGPITVKGRVTEQGTGKAIANAKITILEYHSEGWGGFHYTEFASTYSDVNGYYSIENMNIRISGLGDYLCHIDAADHYDTWFSGGDPNLPLNKCVYQKEINQFDFNLYAIGCAQVHFVNREPFEYKKIFIQNRNENNYSNNYIKEFDLLINVFGNVTDTIKYYVSTQDTTLQFNYPIFTKPGDTVNIEITY